MEIIATTGEGFLIKATSNEVKEILRSVQGEVPKEIKIGQKIPAIDYAGTVTHVKTLKESYQYKQLMNMADEFAGSMSKLRKSIENASEIE